MNRACYTGPVCRVYVEVVKTILRLDVNRRHDAIAGFAVSEFGYVYTADLLIEIKVATMESSRTSFFLVARRRNQTVVDVLNCLLQGN